MSDRFDIAIVGAGLIGSALAFGLRSLRRKLAIVDGSEGGASPSRANFGLIWVQGKGERLAAYGNWTLRSARAWPRLADELRQESGIDVALEQTGGLHVCLSSHELDTRAKYFERVFARDDAERYEVAVLDREALSRRIGGLGPGVAGGTWCPLDGHCNPLRLLHALRTAVVRAGCVYRPNHRVIAVEPSGTGFRLATAHGVIEADRVVIAAGLANARLAAGLDLSVPVRPNKGHILVLERMQRFLPFALDTIRQTDEGAVLVGDSQQDRDDDALSLPVLGAIARRAIATFPVLANVKVVRAWAASRVMSPDGAPIYQASPAHPGAFVVNSHSGVTLAAVHAYVLAPEIGAGGLSGSLAPFSSARFDDVRAAA